MAQRTIVEISPNRYSLEDLALDLTLLGLCVVALFYRIRVTSDLMVPSDVDHYRDIGRAQTILDHRYGDDHLYQGETSPLAARLRFSHRNGLRMASSCIAMATSVGFRQSSTLILIGKGHSWQVLVSEHVWRPQSIRATRRRNSLQASRPLNK